MRYSSQVKPISDLKTNAAKVLLQLAEPREPIAYSTPFGHPFHGHSAGRSERSDAGLLRLLRGSRTGQSFLAPIRVIEAIRVSVTA